MNRKAEQAAARLLDESGVVAPPVPVKRIATDLGVQVIDEKLDREVSGILFREDNGPNIIVVNSTHAPVRRRFSIAHEIGHLRLHAGRPVIVDHLVRGRVNLRDQRSSLATSQEEIEANGFAAAMLMPPDWIGTDVEASLGQPARQMIETLAARYDVSPQAMELRLVNLGLRSAP